MKIAIPAVGLVSILLCACVLAEDDDASARKVTVSLTTGSPAAVPGPKDDSGIATPQFVKAREEMPVEAAVVGVEILSEKVRRPRRIEYSGDHIVIVGLADDSSERTRTVMTDPRLIRAEAFSGESDLPSNRLYRPTVDFSVALDDSAVVKIQILKPRWNGSEWHFDSTLR